MRFAFVSDAVVTEERRDDWREIVPDRELRGRIAAELHRRDPSIVKDTEFVRVRAVTWLLATAAYSLSCTALAATRGRASPASSSHAAARRQRASGSPSATPTGERVCRCGRPARVTYPASRVVRAEPAAFPVYRG